jgi:hypothetical protein
VQHPENFLATYINSPVEGTKDLPLTETILSKGAIFR